MGIKDIIDHVLNLRGGNQAIVEFAEPYVVALEADRFQVEDPTDPTKKVRFAVSAVTTGTTRTVTLPDADVTLGSTADIATHAALTATHGATGAVVGTTNSQVLTNKTLTAPVFSAGSATAGSWPVQTAGTLLTTPEAGAREYDGKVHYSDFAAGQRGIAPSMQLVRADAAFTLTNDTAAQPLFAAATDALTVVAGMHYRFRAAVRLTTGATSCTVSFLVAGSATFTTINYLSCSTAGASGTSATASINNGEAATAVLVVNASTAVSKRFLLEGEFEVNAGGTIIPQIQFSADPTGTLTTNVGSFFECWPLGANPVTSVGAWA